ncbi:MAG: flavodoxin family protein [Spirochaetaceae bacterium]
MKTAVVVYSQTGNTKSVVEKLKAKLEAGGHEVEIEEILPKGETHPGIKNVEFERAPLLKEYEGIVFASPVQAFSLASAMRFYLLQLEDGALEGKKTACLLTKQLPGKWTGGTRAARQIDDLVRSKGSELSHREIIVWSGKKREQKILEALENLARLF